MSQIATLDVLLQASDQQFAGKMKNAQNIVINFKNTVASQGKQATAAAGSMFGSIGGLAARFLGPLAAGAFFGWGIKLAADAEKAQTAFATMLGSADKAKVLLADISKFAAATPFETPELRSAAQSLLSFGVSAGNVMNRLKTLGDVAAGSNSEITDLALIYGKTLAKGKFELEQGNQLAERGIPIYATLAKQMGVSQSSLMDMISAGKVSAADVQKAFESMAGSGGIFEDAMKKQSTTMWGLWSSLTDNIGLIATDIGQILIDTFGFKDGLSALLGATDTIRTTIQEWKPVFQAFVDFVKAEFNLAMEAITAFASFVQPILQPVLDFITGTFGGSLTEFRDNMVGVFAMLEWSVKNWEQVFALAFDMATLSITTFYNDVANFFTSVIPAVFNNFGTATLTFFTNLASNIGNTFKEVWDYIRSGGQNAIEFDWKPLIIDEIKQAFNRELTDSEKALMNSIEFQKNNIMQDMGQFIEGKIAAAGQKAVELSKDILGESTKTDQTDDKKNPKGAIKKTAAVEKGSKAAFEASMEARRENPQLKEMAKQTKIAEDQLKTSKEIAKNTSGKLVPAPL